MCPFVADLQRILINSSKTSEIRRFVLFLTLVLSHSLDSIIRSKLELGRGCHVTRSSLVGVPRPTCLHNTRTQELRSLGKSWGVQSCTNSIGCLNALMFKRRRIGGNSELRFRINLYLWQILPKYWWRLTWLCSPDSVVRKVAERLNVKTKPCHSLSESNVPAPRTRYFSQIPHTL